VTLVDSATAANGRVVGRRGAPVWARWLLARLRPGLATWGVVALPLANCRTDAEKPATAVPGGPGKKGGARCYLGRR